MNGIDVKLKEIIYQLQTNEIHNFEAVDKLMEIYNSDLNYKKKLVGSLENSEIKLLNELIVENINQSFDNFDVNNKIDNILRDLDIELTELRNSLKSETNKVKYFENRFPEFLLKGTEYQKKCYPYYFYEE